MNGTNSETGTIEPGGADTALHAAPEPDTGVHVAPAEPEAAGTQAVDECAELEALLATRARALRDSEAELARTRALLRDAIERFEASVVLGAEQLAAGVRQERDAAVARALEAEAARAEFQFRLDEVLGHLAAAGVSGAEPGQPGERMTGARLSGTVRGLVSALAETQEGSAVSQARLLLTEQDLEDARKAARALERELAETREQLELEALRRERLAERLRGGLEARAAAALKGERDGLRARAEEGERAFAALHEAATAARAEAGEQRAALAVANADRARLTARIAELEQALAREGESRNQLSVELSHARAEQLAVREELARVRADASQARTSTSAAEAERARALEATRALEALQAEFEAARREAREPQAHAERHVQALRATRDQLIELASALSAALARTPSDRGRTAHADAGPAGDGTNGMPTHIEAVEGLEVELAAAEERVRVLENRLAAAAAAARDLAAAPELGPAAAQLQALRALLERG